MSTYHILFVGQGGQVLALSSHVESCLQARYFFQQLLAGLEYCHTKVCCLAQKTGFSCCCMLRFRAACMLHKAMC